MSSTLKPGNASRMVTIVVPPSLPPRLARAPRRVEPLALRPGSGVVRSGSAHAARIGAPRRRAARTPPPASAPVTGRRRPAMRVERMRQLVAAPRRAIASVANARNGGTRPAMRNAGARPIASPTGPGDGHRDRHERERDEEVEARHATRASTAARAAAAACPRRPGAAGEQHADDEERDDHDPEPRGESDDREREAAERPTRGS